MYGNSQSKRFLEQSVTNEVINLVKLDEIRGHSLKTKTTTNPTTTTKNLKKSLKTTEALPKYKTHIHFTICSSVGRGLDFFLSFVFPPPLYFKEPFTDKSSWNLGKEELERQKGQELQSKVPLGMVLTQTLCFTDGSYQGKSIPFVAR